MSELIGLLTAKPEVANAVAALSSAIVALLAFIISVISVYVAHSTLKHQRRHNVLSVSPLPMVAVANYEDLLFVKVRNNGPGPLILKRLAVRKDAEAKESLISWMPALPAGVIWSSYTGLVTDRSIPSNGEITLVELAGDDQDGRFRIARDTVRQALAPLTVAIDYTDVYGTKFSAHEKSLNWFAPNAVLPNAVLPKHRRT